MEATLLLFACTPTTSRLLLPVPTLKFDNVIWFDDDTVPEVYWTLFSVIPFVVDALCVVADAVLDGELVPAEFIADTLYV